MRISTVREFRDNASGMLRAKDPILVTRRGKLAGIFFPARSHAPRRVEARDVRHPERRNRAPASQARSERG